MNSDGSKLVLRDIPIALYLFGLVFAGVGGFGFYQSGQAMLLIFFAVGLGFLLLTSVLTITADRITRTLRLESRSVLLYKVKQISFDDIAGIGVERVSGRSNYTYRVVLKRKDGQLIPLRSSSSSGAGGKERQAGKLRDFIGVPAFDSSPAAITYAALQSYIDTIHETNGVHWQIQPVGSARWHSSDLKTPGVFLCLAQKSEGQDPRGFLASLGSMIFKKVLSSHFQADDTPGLDQVVTLAPLDPILEPHFMAFTNAVAPARQMLNSRAAALLADWASRHPLRQFHKPSDFGQLTILFGPNGVYLTPMNPLQPNQVGELAALGTELVKSQATGRGQATSTF
jgi:hypothetical protein